MLRRNPTALTISPEDITAFEQAHAHAQAYKKFLRTGLDPNGQFTRPSQPSNHQQQQYQQHRQPPQYQNHQNQPLPVQEEFNRAHARFHTRMAQNTNVNVGAQGDDLYRYTRGSPDERRMVTDPNDELKPLPGDKARIVRSREERIMGVGGRAGGVAGAGTGTGIGR